MNTEDPLPNKRIVHFFFFVLLLFSISFTSSLIAKHIHEKHMKLSQVTHIATIPAIVYGRPLVDPQIVLSSVGEAVAPTPTPVPTDPVALGQDMAAQYGWVGSEWNALYSLWERESGWSVNATNPSSYAHGIVQALPYSKTGCGWDDAYCQIAWGLNYIKNRYGDPLSAIYHEDSEGWY